MNNARRECSPLQVLDACCGPKGMWFKKNNPLAVYIDKRKGKRITRYPSATYVDTIAPDILASFCSLPFKDNSFSLVVMDPPHISQTANSGRIVFRYGMLGVGWKDMLRNGFNECFRVLRPNGTLIFKWNECRIPVKEILELSPIEPLFGNRSGKAMRTHWLVFLKPSADGSLRQRVEE